MKKTTIQSEFASLPKKMQVLEDLAKKYKNVQAQFPITDVYRRNIRKSPEAITLPMYRQALSRLSSTWIEAKMNGGIPPILAQHFGNQYKKTTVLTKNDPDEILESQHLFNAAMIFDSIGFISFYEKMLDERVAREFIDTFAEPALLKDPDRYFKRIKGKAGRYQERFLYMINLADNMAALSQSYPQITKLRDKTLELLYPLVKKNYFEGENLERIGQTKNGMYFIKGEKQWLFKECRSQEAVEEEFKFTRYLGNLLRKTEYDVPIPLTTFMHSQPPDYYQPVLVLENLEGETLEKKILDSDPSLPEYYEGITKCLGKLHREVEYEDVIDMSKKIRTKYDGVIGDSLSEALTSLNTIIAETNDIVYFKDANIENWIISPTGKIAVIDCERPFGQYQAIDLVKLLLYFPSDFEEQEYGLIRTYLDSYKQEDHLEEDFIEQFYLSVLNGKLQQLFVDYSDYSSRDQKAHLCPHLIEKGFSTIEQIRNNYPSHYSQYQEDYISLQEILKEF
ncbi:MAG: hypothetical protein R6V53_03385 [Candidatus Woesearchaeota archaeon]